MRQTTPRIPMRRIVAALLLAALFAPASVRAQDEQPAESVEEEEATEGSEAAAPAPVETRWYHRLQRDADIAADLLIIRPLSGVTAFAGAVLFVPAAIFTAPNGMDSLREAYDRFVREPGEYFATRPLGEF